MDPGEGATVFAAGVNWKTNFQARIAVGPDGTLLLVWTQYVQGHPDNAYGQEWGGGRLAFASSTNGGLSWSPVGTVEAGGEVASPVIGRDGG